MYVRDISANRGNLGLVVICHHNENFLLSADTQVLMTWLALMASSRRYRQNVWTGIVRLPGTSPLAGEHSSFKVRHVYIFTVRPTLKALVCISDYYYNSYDRNTRTKC